MWDQIKQVIDEIGGKFVIAEGGKPKYIVLAFEEFKKFIRPNSDAPSADSSFQSSAQIPAQTASGPLGPTAQRAVASPLMFKREEEEFADTPDNINQKIADLAHEDEEAQKIKIEDLPF